MHLLLPPSQVEVLAIGAIVPLVTYVVNHYAPWKSEQVKAIVHVLAAAIAGGLFQALDKGDLGFNATTLQFVGSAIAAALFAHNMLYKPAGHNVALGGGSDA